MIVRPHAGGLLLITQPEHARLSGDLVSAWRSDGILEHPRRDAILLATREHDNGWIEADASPGLDPVACRPFDFMHAPVSVRLDIWRRGIARLAARSPRAAALVAEHALTIQSHHRHDEGWAALFETVEGRRDDLLRACGAFDGDERQAFERDYALLYLGDILSLLFCNGWTETVEARGRRAQLRGAELRVMPDPFEGKRVPIAVDGRLVDDRAYASAEDLGRAIAAAPEVTLSGAAVGW
jgi:hypothetical protein